MFIEDNVTLICKTVLRPKALTRLLRSVRFYYPTMPFIVGSDEAAENDQFDPTLFTNLRYERQPLDCGVSEGRNRLVDLVTTPYLMLVDDDFEFISSTRLDKLWYCLEQCNLDLVGGWLIRIGTEEATRRALGLVQQYNGMISVDTLTNTVVFKAGFSKHHHLSMGSELVNCKECEITLQFFMARTEVIKRVRWDDKLKIGGEHQDFFLRAKENHVHVGVCPDVVGLHHVELDGNHAYRELRRRDVQYQELFLRSRQINGMEFIPIDGWR